MSSSFDFHPHPDNYSFRFFFSLSFNRLTFSALTEFRDNLFVNFNRLRIWELLPILDALNQSNFISSKFRPLLNNCVSYTRDQEGTRRRSLRGLSNFKLLRRLSDCESNDRGEKNAVTCCYRCIANRVDDAGIYQCGFDDDADHLRSTISRGCLHHRRGRHVFTREQLQAQ